MKIEKDLYSGLRIHFSRITKKVAEIVAKIDNVKLDDTGTEIYLELQELQKEIEKEFEDDKLFGMVLTSFAIPYYTELFDNNAKEMNKIVFKFIGENLPLEVIMAMQYFNAFKGELRIKSKYWVDSYFTRLNNLFIKYNSKNITLGKLLKSIEVLNQSVAKNIPANISKDTIGTFNSYVQEVLFRSFGFNEYIWETANDERVRGNPSGPYKEADPSHYIMNGLLCRWDNSLVYSDDDGKTWKSKYGKMEKEQVGRAINCRCTASPFMKPVIDDINRRL